MKRILYLAIAVLMAGCTGFGAQGLSPEQIKASANVKDINALCFQTAGPWGNVLTNFLSVDQRVLPKDGNGKIGLTKDCEVTFSQASGSTTLVPAVTVTPMVVTPMSIAPAK